MGIGFDLLLVFHMGNFLSSLSFGAHLFARILLLYIFLPLFFPSLLHFYTAKVVA